MTDGMRVQSTPAGSVVLPERSALHNARAWSFRRARCGCRVWFVAASCRYLEISLTLGEHAECGPMRAAAGKRAKAVRHA